MNPKVVLILVFVVLASGIWYYSSQKAGSGMEENLPAEQPSQPSQPLQITYLNATPDMIVVEQPTPGGVIESDTLMVSGRARGGWYFEADFPLEVLDSAGNRLVIQPVSAEGDWMTEEFVPFSAEVALPASYRGPAMLVLHNHNASGLPENEKSVAVPIVIE